jgi:DNA-binding PadR family transcriptional regulator
VSTSHLLLGLLARGPQHGYELKRAHDGRLPAAKPLAFGQVYATLGRLVRDGLVEAAGADQAGGPERVQYRLTEAGRAALRDWLDSVEVPAAFLGGAMFAKVVVALLAADQQTATRYLVNQRAAHMARMRELTQLKHHAASVGEAAAADYTIAHLDADLRWMQQTMARVEALDKEISA